jgi:F-type H+-transporting ATPase subunit delta
MSRSPVVETYARTLLELAVREERTEEFGRHLAEIVSLAESEADVRRFLETPRVDLADKKRAVREALSGRAPETFIRFLLVVLDKGRQRLLPQIEAAYHDLLDEREGRVHAEVTLARDADEELQAEIRRGLEEAFERQVVPHFHRDEKLIGGLLVRVGDRVMDGSVRRRLEDMRRALARVPAGGVGPAADRGAAEAPGQV